MQHFIGCDAHKKYSVFVAVDEHGQASRPAWVSHEREVFREFLRTLPEGSPIALESTGYWYGMVDEMEKAQHLPLLADAKRAKALMGCRNKTDKLDARGLGVLLRNGTLPTVWIADALTRDLRELPRMRRALVGVQTKLKNRVHACFNRYGIALDQASDVFGAVERRQVPRAAAELPSETRQAVELQLTLLDQLRGHLGAVQQRLRRMVRQTAEMKLWDTLPGVGWVLSVVVALEIGDIRRFPYPERLVSQAGLVPRVYSSGGRTRHGSIAPDVNRTLRWAFVEAAHVVVRNRERWPQMGLVRLYHRVAAHKAPAVAKIALARKLAESAFWVLKKKQPYREPRCSAVLSSSR